MSSYTAGQSLFMRYLFFLDSSELARNPSLGPQLQNAAVNTLDGGFFCLSCRFSVDTLPVPDYATWLTSYTGQVLNTDFPTARQWNMALFATGDYAFRSTPQIYDFLHTPWNRQAFQTILANARDSQVFIGVDMIDESNLVLGNYAKPAGKVNSSGPFNKIEVFGCPSVPCLGTGILHYRYDSIPPGSSFQIRGSSVNALNGPHIVGNGTNWTLLTADLTGKLTVPNHGVTQNGIPARFSYPRWASTYIYSLPGGLSENVTYYLIVVDSNTLRVAATLSDALAGRSLTISSPGSGAFLSYGTPYDGQPYNSTAKVAWTFTTQDVPNGVYDAGSDPNLEIVIWNTNDWFNFQYFGKRLGADGPAQISIASSIATANWPNHGLTTDQNIKIKNASDPKLNGPYRVTVVNASTITFSTANISNRTITPSTDPSLTVDIGYFPNWDNNLANTILSAADQVPNRPPISWPVLGDSDNESVQRWMGDPTVSNFASLYLSEAFQPYDYGSSLFNVMHDMKAAAFDRMPYIQRNQPKILLVAGGTANYFKQSAGDHFMIGSDKLGSYAPYRPETVTAGVILAAAAGMSGVRVYGYQALTNTSQVIQNAPIGTDITLQISPTVQPKKWAALSKAFNFVKDLEPYILQPNISSPNLGPLAFTGAKEGNGGRLLMTTSFSEVPQTLRIDFTPYTYEGSVTRYRISSTAYSSAVIPTTSGEAITLAPGETVAYLFQR